MRWLRFAGHDRPLATILEHATDDALELTGADRALLCRELQLWRVAGAHQMTPAIHRLLEALEADARPS